MRPVRFALAAAVTAVIVLSVGESRAPAGMRTSAAHKGPSSATGRGKRTQPRSRKPPRRLRAATFGPTGRAQAGSGRAHQTNRLARRLDTRNVWLLAPKATETSAKTPTKAAPRRTLRQARRHALERLASGRYPDRLEWLRMSMYPFMAAAGAGVVAARWLGIRPRLITGAFSFAIGFGGAYLADLPTQIAKSGWHPLTEGGLSGAPRPADFSRPRPGMRAAAARLFAHTLAVLMAPLSRTDAPPAENHSRARAPLF